MRDVRVFALSAVCLICSLAPAGNGSAFTVFRNVPTGGPVLAGDTVATGLILPIFVTASNSDTSRIFVVELSGKIRVIKNGILLPDPFLDITAQTCNAAENGLLGLAFHPDYASNGYFYVKYTDNACNIKVCRFIRSTTSADSANPATEFLILAIDQPFEPNHNGGTIAFGPDGMLYIPTGDGNCCGDPFGHAQNGNVLNGKLLRIDVDRGSPYAIPPDNPYFGSLSVRNEIVGFGLRNPYRCSFDRATGDLYLADVGQDTWEEVSFLSSSGLTAARNFGWPILEGTHCYEGPSSLKSPAGCNTAGLQLPIHEYEHLGTCSITGGYVYRGCAIPQLQGRYLFGDFCSGQVWSITHDGSAVTDLQDHTSDIGTGNFVLVGFGEDARGEMYVCTLDGTVYKIVPQGVSSTCAPCACDCHGDPVCDSTIDILDVVSTFDVAFRGGASIPDPNPLCPYETTDTDCNGSTDVLDGVHEINVAFRNGNPGTEFCKPCP